MFGIYNCKRKKNIKLCYLIICNFLLGLVDQLRHVLLYRFPLVTTVTRNKILNHYSFEALTKINKEHMQFDSLSYPRSKLIKWNINAIK